MKKIIVTDEWLYKYMPVVDEAIIRELEKEIDYEYPFTGRFEHRMKKLIRWEMHPWIGAFYRWSKKAAILFVCVISTLFVITMSVQAYRIKFFETVQSIWEDSILYTYFVDQNPGTIQWNEPGYLPEGYQETEKIILEHWFSVIYTDGDGNTITWDQMLVQDEGKLTVDIEWDQQVIKESSGKNIMISLYLNGSVNAYCEHGKYVYLLTADNLSIDEICRIFDSVAVD
ncbi:MAG: DUF4367 domain-containing protein [Eubacterium sp.]|nr:DUF4367 domain-containing protein [Eubacterium sp.]